MALVAVVSAKGSPGVTTTVLALALTWPSQVVAAECDPAGGDVLAGYFGGSLPETAGLLGVIAATADGDDRTGRGGGDAIDLQGNLVALDTDGTRLVLPGVTGPAQAAALRTRWGNLAETFTGLRLSDNTPGVRDGGVVDVLADCGRLGAAYAPVPLMRSADLVVLVARSDLRSVRAAHAWAGKLSDDLAAHGRGGQRLGMLLVGDRRPYRCVEIAAHLGLPSLGVLAWDPKAASVLSDGTGSGRGLTRSPLLRTARSLASGLRRLLAQNASAESRAAGGDSTPQWLQRDARTPDSEAVTRHG